MDFITAKDISLIDIIDFIQENLMKTLWLSHMMCTALNMAESFDRLLQSNMHTLLDIMNVSIVTRNKRGRSND